MKKLLALLLAIVLCLSMTACGDKEYDELIEMLEAGDYESAIAYIRSMQGSEGNLKLDGVIGIQVETNATEPLTAEITAILNKIPGKWVCTTEKENAPKEFLFRADGTCTVDGKNLIWKRNGTTTHSSLNGKSILSLTIQEGDVNRYDATFYQGNGEEIVLTCEVYEDSNNTNSISGVYYVNHDAYDMVELSADNWQEYFEWTEEFCYDTNAFGEVSSLGTKYFFSLKEEYYNRLSPFQINQGDVEISHTLMEHYVSISADGKSYTKGDHNYREGHQYTQIHELRKQNDTTVSLWGAQYAYASVREYKNYPLSEFLCDYVISHSVTRIQGTLYLLKNN